MRRLATSLVILVIAASFSFAQGKMPQKEWNPEMMGRHGEMMEHMMGGMHSMMYSMMVQHVLMKVNTLNLTDTQKKELANIKEKYVYPMVRKEGDFKISHMKIMDMLQDPNFDPTKIKGEIKASNEINLEMANMSIDALTAIRKEIGIENFKKVSEMMPMMGGGMMRGGPIMEKKGTVKEKPAQ